MTKNELRQIYRQKRMALSKEECRSKNDAIAERLKERNWLDCGYLHVYQAIRKFNEPDISEFVTWLRVNQPQVNLVVSKSNLLDSAMLHYVWDEETQFEINKWGVLEPVGGHPIPDSLLDVVFVPMLVADRKGNRVGYGKGFYDRFLAQCKPDVQTVGISYFEVVDEVADAGYWDIPLTSVVTPEGFYPFQR